MQARPFRRRFITATGALLFVASVAFPPQAGAAEAAAQPATKAKAADPMDWLNWRGPEQCRVSREKNLIDQWDPATGENVLWQNDELGGISSPIVMNGRLYTIVRHAPGTEQEQEKVICVDAATGKTIWESRFNVYLSDVPAERVGWSSCVADPTTGRIYAMGVNGFFQCLDGTTGKTLWSHSLNEEYGLLSTYGGRTNIPVVFDDLVIISAVVIGWGEGALPAHRFIAFNKATGQPVWFNGTALRPEDTTYSTPFVTVLNGQAAMVFGSSDGSVWAFQPRTGKPLWNFKISRRGLSASPVVTPGGLVVMGNSEENLDNQSMGAIVAFRGDGDLSGDITKQAEVWRAPGAISKTSLVYHDDRIYACEDNGKLHVLKAETGEPICKPIKLVGTIVRASPLVADGKLYVCTTSAWHVYKITEQGLKPIQRLRLGEDDEVAGSMCVSHGRIYLPTVGRMYCLGTAENKPVAEKLPVPPTEAPVADDRQPAWVQVTPVEVLMAPGKTQAFTVRLFNSRGQFLEEAAGKSVKFSVEGPGEIDAEGTFTAPSERSHQAAIVTAAVGDLKGTARIRIVPPLPWEWDFDNVPLAKGPSGKLEGEPAVTWIGMRYRHKIREVDGEQVMVKVTTIPKGTRSQGWFGPADLHDYTIQADVRGALTNGKLPDIGMIAQRYTLDMMGESQQLQIRSWTPQIATRFSKNVPFRWDESKWYVMKFRASNEDGKAVLRGKVWPKDETEPAEWTIEAVDEVPNTHGSPGLFGNASVSEIYYDNISVTPNG
jgi:outer membrane protein assembly factor BamB